MKIALIAMSGIRAYDEELLRLGLTLPGFVERSKTIANLPSLGLLTLAGMTPARHQVTYIEVPDIRDLPELPTGFDLVAISSYSAQMNEGYELSCRYRALGVPTVLGGPHVSALPDEAAEHCTTVVVGEGEAVWPQVLEDAERGALQPRYGTTNGDYDLRDAPMPAFELLDIARYNRLTVQTSRGCPHQCAFCASSVLLTRRYKQKPPAKVLAEVDRIKAIWRRPFIEFADDNSFVDVAYWKALLPELAKRHVRWFTETDISVAEDEELLTLLQKSGCAEILVGLESPVPAGLDGLEMHSNWKARRYERYRDAIRTIQGHGIRVNACFILGLDGQGPEVFKEILEFARTTPTFDVQITIQTPFPGTPLYTRLKKEGRLLDDGDWRKYTLFDVVYVPEKMTVAELAHGLRNVGVQLYSDHFTAFRREAFNDGLRALRRKEVS